MLYLDEEADRVRSRAQAEVEAVRLGTVFAHNLDAYRKWRSSLPSRRGRTGLTGAALEAAVMRIAALFPENVVHVAGDG